MGIEQKRVKHGSDTAPHSRPAQASSPSASDFEAAFSLEPTTPDLLLTSENVLSLQRAIGNAATTRLVAERTAASKSPAVTGASPRIQRLMTEQDLRLTSDAESWGEGEQSKSTLGKLKKFGKDAKKKASGLQTSVFQDVIIAVNTYHKSTRETPIQANKQARAKFVEYLDGLLDTIDQRAQAYIEKHVAKNDRPKTVSTFQNLQNGVDPERYKVKIALKNLDEGGDYDNSQGKPSETTWHYYMFAALNTKTLAKVASELGISEAYIAGLHPDALRALIAANDALERKDLEEAQENLDILQRQMPDAFPLIKSTLLRKHMKNIDPEVDQMINDPKYERKETNDAYVKMQSYDTKFSGNLASFEEQRDAGDDKLAEYAKTKNMTPDQFKAFKQQFKARQDWEKDPKNVDLNTFKNMDVMEGIHLGAYSGNSGAYNDQMRGMKLDEAPKEDHYQNKKHIRSQQVGSLVSAMNKLPNFTGTVYRHDAEFKGIKKFNLPGSVVSDLAPLSTSREANTLAKPTFEVEVLSVIESSTGKYIKPASSFNTVFAGSGKDENEVLFKPGTQFRVLSQFEAQRDASGAFKKDADGFHVFNNLPASIQTALKADPYGRKIRLILHKQDMSGS